MLSSLRQSQASAGVREPADRPNSLTEEAAIEVGNPHQRDRRAVGESDRGAAVDYLRRADHGGDGLGVFAGKGNRVARGLVEPEDGIVDYGAVIDDQIRTGSREKVVGNNGVAAASADDRAGSGPADDRVGSRAAENRVRCRGSFIGAATEDGIADASTI